MLPDGVVQRELALLDELQRRHRGEHLVHRPDAEPRVGSVGVPTSRFSRPQALRSKSFPSRATEQRAGELTLACELRGAVGKRRQRVRLCQSVENEVQGA